MTPEQLAEAEERLADAVTDERAWQVYGDLLCEQGAPWGEVIARGCAGGDLSAQERKVLALARGIDNLEATWAHGVLDSLTLMPEEHPGDEGPTLDEALEAILRHPAGRLVRSLTLGLPPPRHAGDINWNFDAELAVLARVGPLPLLEKLDLSVPAEHMDQRSWRRIGDFEPVWASLPRLRTLTAQGSVGSDRDGPQLKLGVMKTPRLESLILESSGLDGSVPVDLGKASLPALKHLELWFGRQEYGCGCTVESLGGFLAGDGLPALQRLGLMNSQWETELIEAVAGSPLLRQLEVLDLSMGILCDEAAEALLRHAPKLAHLKKLVLADNYFAPDDVRALQRALPMVLAHSQKQLEGDVGDPYSRYCTVGE